MSTSNDSSDSLSSERNSNPTHEYYEEVDHQTLDLHKRIIPKPVPSKSVSKELPHPINPIQQLNEQLNRQFRPDLVRSTSESFFSLITQIEYSRTKRFSVEFLFLSSP